MKDNIIDKYKNDTNELLIKELGMTFEEFKSLSTEELKLIFFSHKLKKLKKHIEKSKNNDIDSILDSFRQETNQIIIETYGITFDEFTTLSIPELIDLVNRGKKHTR